MFLPCYACRFKAVLSILALQGRYIHEKYLYRQSNYNTCIAAIVHLCEDWSELVIDWSGLVSVLNRSEPVLDLGRTV